MAAALSGVFPPRPSPGLAGPGLGLQDVPQQQPEAALDVRRRGPAGAAARRRQPQVQVQGGGERQGSSE